MALLQATGHIVHTSGKYNSKGEFIAREARSKLKWEKPKRGRKDADDAEKRREQLKELVYILDKLK